MLEVNEAYPFAFAIRIYKLMSWIRMTFLMIQVDLLKIKKSFYLDREG